MSERDEGVVRMDASLWVLVCEMRALDVQVLAMTAANYERDSRGESLAYPEASFTVVSEEYDKLAQRIRETI